MSRTQAAGKTRFRKGRLVRISHGKISREMMLDWIQPMGVELRGAGSDESPHCYKRLPQVLEAHSKTIRVLHTLTPIGTEFVEIREDDLGGDCHSFSLGGPGPGADSSIRQRHSDEFEAFVAC